MGKACTIDPVAKVCGASTKLLQLGAGVAVVDGLRQHEVEVAFRATSWASATSVPLLVPPKKRHGRQCEGPPERWKNRRQAEIRKSSENSISLEFGPFFFSQRFFVSHELKKIFHQRRKPESYFQMSCAHQSLGTEAAKWIPRLLCQPITWNNTSWRDALTNPLELNLQNGFLGSFANQSPGTTLSGVIRSPIPWN